MQSRLYIILVLAAAIISTVSAAEHSTNKSSGCVGCDSSPVNSTEKSHKTFIFIQEGFNGTFVKDKSGNYTLTMNDVVPYTMFMADRPARDVGLAPMDKFLKGFDFRAANPPNAAIILPDENNISDMIAVELTNPQYNNTTQTLMYTAKLIKAYAFASEWLNDHISEIDPAIPERFGTVEVVIDDCPCNVVLPSVCSIGCRNQCWNWHEFMCDFCGGCCHKPWQENNCNH